MSASLTGDVLARYDQKLHRCDCGAWLYARHPCTTCAVLDDTTASHTDDRRSA